MLATKFLSFSFLYLLRFYIMECIFSFFIITSVYFQIIKMKYHVWKNEYFLYLFPFSFNQFLIYILVISINKVLKILLNIWKKL